MKRAIICLKADEFGQSVLNLGRQGEDNAVRVLVDIGEYLKQDAGAQAALSAETPGGYVYPVIAAMSGTTLTWNIGESDVAEAGSGQVQLTITGTDGEVLKFATAKTRIEKSVTGSGEPPAPVEDWVAAGGKAATAVVSSVMNEITDKTTAMETSLLTKVDDGYVENGYLYLTANGEVVVGPLGPFSGTGGGGGSGGNNAVVAMSNTTGWLAKTISLGSECKISWTWSSKEDDIATGNGTVFLTVGGSLKLTKNVEQGTVEIDIKDYLTAGVNAVRVKVTDVYGNSRTMNFTVTVVEATISSGFDASSPFTGAVTYTYTPTGKVDKTVHFMLDGTEIGTSLVSASGRQQSYVIPAQAHGAHSLLVYYTAMIETEQIRSNELYYDLMWMTESGTAPIIASPFRQTTAKQYESLTIPWTVYSPASLTSEVVLKANGTVVSTQTVGRTEQTWTYRADSAGALKLQIVCGSTTKTFNLTVAETQLEVSAETNNLSLYLSSYGRSNNEATPGTWTSGGITSSFSGFNFASDGWQQDEDGITVLRVANDARLTVNYKPFANDFRTTGKTIEVEFATRNVLNYDAVIANWMSGGTGIEITAQKATLKSEQSEIGTQFKENEHVRVAFVVEKKSENRLVYIYINGIMTGATQYPEDDDFSQTSPVNITFGSNECTTDIYCIRVYDNDLTRYQILDNWIADTQNINEKLARYERNHIFDEYGQIVIGNLPSNLPYLVLRAPVLPSYKGNKLTVAGSYTDPTNSGRSFAFENATADVQGTSSAGYARKNYKIKFSDGFTVGGVKVEGYSLRPESLATKTFTFKADVASSEGANNVELVRLYNNICPYKTPPQVSNAVIRQGIDGFPIVIFHDNGENTAFIGKYNFNNDKGTPEIYGFADGDESWEILNNTSDRVLWKSADFTGDGWKNDFEARYPEDNENVASLSAFASWLVSTDQSAATGNALAASVTYDGQEYTKDTAAYRLAKFKAELANYADVDDSVFYYLFTELFLMVDSRAKNAFPTKFSTGKFCWLPYDFDTAIGINNEGALVFDYHLEDIDKTESGADVYNGQNSVMWVNLRQAFFDKIKAMYQKLRSDGVLSYDVVEKAYEEHQSKWPEAVWNEDAYYKYLEPLVADGSSAYLSMLQGSKEEQRKWWLYNRFRYMDSKYNAGDSLSDIISLRGYAKSNITIEPYADIYASVKYGSYLQQTRALRGQKYTLPCPLDNVNDTEIYIYSASQLKSVGDLSGLKVGYAEFSLATKLQSLKLGDSSTDYSNSNLTELYLGNNVLLKTLDVRNCPKLGTEEQKTINLSGCKNIEHVYFDGTVIGGCSLPNGGVLKTLHLPGTITNLTIRNQPSLTDFTMPSYSNISTLWLENVSSAVNSRTILSAINASSRVRLIGVNWTADSIEDAIALYDKLDTMRGIDENGNNTDKPQVSGKITVDSLTGAQLADMQSRYPDIEVVYSHITSHVYFYTHDGATLLDTQTAVDGGNVTYGGTTPTRSATAQYTYTFAGWSLTVNGSVNSAALTNVTADRNVYAAYAATLQKYTVYFYNGSTLLQTVQNVPYGGSASYTGTTPVYSGDNSDEYQFIGWLPSPINIIGTTSCYAIYRCLSLTETITDSWEEILAAVEDGTYKTKYQVGDTKILDVGSAGNVCMQIAAFDADTLADGTGKAPISWISEQLLPMSCRMNPQLSVEEYGNKTVQGWDERIWDATSKAGYIHIYGASRLMASEEATYAMQFTALSAFKIWVPSAAASGSASYKDCEIEVVVNGTVIFKQIGSTELVPLNTKVSVEEGEEVNITLRFKQSSTASASTERRPDIYLRLADSADAAISFISVVCGPDWETDNIPPSYLTKTISQNQVWYDVAYVEGSGAIGGWKESEMRAYLNDSIKPLIPALVRAAIKPVTKTHTYANAQGQYGSEFIQTTTDEIWFPSNTEIRNSSGLYGSLFQGLSASRVKKRVGEEKANSWWLRDVTPSMNFYCIESTGLVATSSCYETHCIALCFCT